MNPTAEARPYEVLLVEDNPGDVRLVMEALRDGLVPKRIHVVEDGVEALAYLRGDDSRFPDLVLLDLNLPRKNGHEVLAELRSDPRLQGIPVIIFTSSSAEQDVRAAYGLCANCYVTKPPCFSELMETIKRIERFWFTTATLPTRGPYRFGSSD